MKLSVFCGMSVDGFLARPDHALAFLHTGWPEPRLLLLLSCMPRRTSILGQTFWGIHAYSLCAD